jgi:NitT/TauT family transport system permease protein
MTFFPLLLASISGFQILDTRFLYLTQSMGATRWQTFRYLRFPAALPVFSLASKRRQPSPLQQRSSPSLSAPIEGLGFVLLRGTGTMDLELVFAVLVVLTVMESRSTT